jgi:MFS family permease
MIQAWVAAVTVSWLGDAAWMVALAWTAAHTLSPAMAGVVIGAEMIPQAALVLVGGVVADRFDPRRLVIAGQLAKAAIIGLGALAWTAGLTGAPTLLAVALAFGSVTGLVTPAGPAFFRQIVAPDDLGTVSGWNQIANRVARLVGAPLGGVLVAWGGPVPAMLVNAGSFLVVAAVTSYVVVVRYRMPRAEHERWQQTFADGLRYLRRTPMARVFVTGLTALNVFVTPVVVLGLALNVSQSGWGARWVGIADAALAAGAIGGSLVAIRWQPTRMALSAFQMLVVEGAMLAGVGVGWLPAVVASMAGLGVTAGIASVWLSTAFLRAVDPSQIGRVTSVTSLGDMTLVPLSVPALGAIAAASSVLTATVVFGVAASALCLFFATRPSIARVG